MNAKHFFTISALALSLISAPSFAKQGMNGEHHSKKYSEHFSPEAMQKRFDRLKNELKIQKNQEQAWQRYVDFHIQSAQNFKQMRPNNIEEFKNMTRTERMEKGIEFHKQKQKHMEQKLEETKRLYQALNKEQQAIFDQPRHKKHKKDKH